MTANTKSRCWYITLYSTIYYNQTKTNIEQNQAVNILLVTSLFMVLYLKKKKEKKRKLSKHLEQVLFWYREHLNIIVKGIAVT